MKLGDVVQNSIGVPDLAEAVAFYEALGFSQIATSQEPWPWAQFSEPDFRCATGASLASWRWRFCDRWFVVGVEARWSIFKN